MRTCNKIHCYLCVLRDEEDGISYGSEQLNETNVRRRGMVREKSEKVVTRGETTCKRETAVERQLRACYSIIDNASPRMEGCPKKTKSRKYLPGINKQHHDDMRVEGG